MSQNPWRDDNSFGNTFSNILEGINEFEIANVYFGAGLPNANFVSKYYQVNERLLIQNLISRKSKSGIEIHLDELNSQKDIIESTQNDLKKFSFFQKNRWMLFFWLRELIWFFGNWKSKELHKFIDDFKPDIVFLPLYPWVYMNKIGLYIHNYCKVPMVSYVSDDHYTLKQYSWNPFFWIDRLIKRIYVKKVAIKASILYVISEIQKQDYDIAFNQDCKILFKGANFHGSPVITNVEKPINFLYTGNLYAGRSKILGEIGKALDLLQVGFLNIYTASPITNKIRNELSAKSIVLNGAVSYNQVLEIQAKAHVLIHVESFEKKFAYLVRQSFSTKIVDYLKAAKCIFAVGKPYVASIDYLHKNNIAIVATSESQIYERLLEISNDLNKIQEYSIKAWDFGLVNHDINTIQSNLLLDIQHLINDKKN